MKGATSLGVGVAEWGSGYKIVHTQHGLFEGHHVENRSGRRVKRRRTPLQVGKAYRLFAVEVPLSEVPKDE